MFIVGPPPPCVFSTKGPPAVDFGGPAMVTIDVVEAPARMNTSQALPWSTSSQGWKPLGLWNRLENRSAIGMHAMCLRSFGTSKEQRMMPTFTILDVDAISIGVARYLDRFSGVLGRSTMFTRSLWHWSHAILDSLALPSTSFPLLLTPGYVQSAAHQELTTTSKRSKGCRRQKIYWCMNAIISACNHFRPP